MARPIAGFVVSMGPNGTILSQGTVSEALAKDHALAKELGQKQKAFDKAEDVVDSPPPGDKPKSDGKLIVEEEIEEGHVSWAARE